MAALPACNFARRLKTLRGRTPCENICEIWTAEPESLNFDPTHQMPGLNSLSPSTSGRLLIRPPLSLRPMARHGSSLQISVQRGPGQMRKCRLQCVHTIIRWQEEMPLQDRDDSFLVAAQNRRTGGCRPGLLILYCRALAPLENRLRVYSTGAAQLRDQGLRFSGRCYAISCQPGDRCIAALVRALSDILQMPRRSALRGAPVR